MKRGNIFSCFLLMSDMEKGSAQAQGPTQLSISIQGRLLTGTSKQKNRASVLAKPEAGQSIKSQQGSARLQSYLTGANAMVTVSVSVTASAAHSSFASHLSRQVQMRVPTVLLVDVNYLLPRDGCSATQGELQKILLECPEGFDPWKLLTLGDLIVHHCQGQCLLPFVPLHIISLS